MSHHVPYQPFSLECPKEIIRMVRGRTVRDELPLFAKCVHTLVGTALGATIGEPADVEPVFGAVDESELEACREELQAAYDDAMVYGAEGEEAIDPATIAMLIQLAVTLITKWLERRKQGS